jgi:hypothetical protein
MKKTIVTLACCALIAPLAFAQTMVSAAMHVHAGAGSDFTRGELMGNSGLTIWRVADFGWQQGLCIYIDEIPLTVLSRGEGYRAVVRPGHHTLSVTNTPSPYGKTKFYYRTVNFAPGQNYSFTAIWEVEKILIENGGYQYHGFYR